MQLLAFNSDTFAPSEYLGLDFTQIFPYNGKYYGLTEIGVYELTGLTDAGTNINCSIKTGKLFADYEELRCARMYLKCQAADSMQANVTVDVLDASSNSAEETTEYVIPGVTGTKQRVRTERLRRDIKGGGWQFEISNVDGGDFYITGLMIEPEGIEIDA